MLLVFGVFIFIHLLFERNGYLAVYTPVWSSGIPVLSTATLLHRDYGWVCMDEPDIAVPHAWTAG